MDNTKEIIAKADITDADREAAQDALNHAFRNTEVTGHFDLADLAWCFARHRQPPPGMVLVPESVVEALTAKLQWYGDQFCEGICEGHNGDANVAYDCSGCPARVTLWENRQALQGIARPE